MIGKCHTRDNEILLFAVVLDVDIRQRGMS